MLRRLIAHTIGIYDKSSYSHTELHGMYRSQGPELQYIMSTIRTRFSVQPLLAPAIYVLVISEMHLSPNTRMCENLRPIGICGADRMILAQGVIVVLLLSWQNDMHAACRAGKL